MRNERGGDFPVWVLAFVPIILFQIGLQHLRIRRLQNEIEWLMANCLDAPENAPKF